MPTMLNKALATAAPTMPSTTFIRSPILLFMNCSASQPALAPMMIAAIQPTLPPELARLLEPSATQLRRAVSDDCMRITRSYRSLPTSGIVGPLCSCRQSDQAMGGATITYCLDLFTPETWAACRGHGSGISGFRERQRKTAD